MWGTDDETRTAYMDTQDVARLTLAALRWGGREGPGGLHWEWLVVAMTALQRDREG